jgi:hypothetical protein
VAGRADARRLAERARPVGAVAQDGAGVPWRRAEAEQHAAQLLRLPVGLGRHAAEHDLLAFGGADLGDEDLEGAHPIAAHRPHVAGVDAESDRALLRRRRGRLRRRQRRSLEPGPDLQRALPGGLDRRGVAEREELREQRQGADGTAARRPSRRPRVRTPACSGLA